MAESAIFEWMVTGGVLALAGVSIGTYIHVGKMKDEQEQKRARVYERLDEVKKDLDEKFVHKDICKVLHEQMARDLVDIKTDVKLLLRKNGIKDG